MNPRHTNPTKPERTAHAPYNFVPLPEKVVPADYQIPCHDTYEHYTGYLECSLTTLTPVYTRCALDPGFFARWADNIRGMMRDAEARKTYARFFHLDDVQRPVIPGSTLRGMIRALVEIVGYGKVQWVTDKRLVFRAVGDPSSLGDLYRSLFLGANKTTPPDMHFDYPSRLLKGGYLRITTEGYAIQPAKEFEGESFIHVEYNQANGIIKGYGRQRVHDVFVKPEPRKTLNRGRRGRGVLKLDVAVTRQVSHQPERGLVRAKLIESGHMGGQHAKHWHCAIYEPDPAAKLIPIPDQLWLLYVLDREAVRGLPTRKLKDVGDPLFYLLNEQNQLVFFGPTMMFRLPYVHSPYELVPSSIRDSEVIDLAEAIFGFPSEEGRATGRAGRVFFTDAVCVPNQRDVWLPEGVLIPRVLASPKPTAFQHYLVQDKSKNHDPDIKRGLAHYDTPAPEETVLRGHKLYWHKRGGLSAADFCERQSIDWNSDTQHTQIKPVRAGVEFRFRIYFENLTKAELGALLWAVDLPPGHHHKLGMGKPLGLGSVAIKPRLVLSDRKDRYSRLFLGDRWHTADREESDLGQFREAFEQFVLDRIDPGERGNVRELADLKRIQSLLAMLRWPGPADNTHYMELDRFRERPVLPDPLSLR